MQKRKPVIVPTWVGILVLAAVAVVVLLLFDDGLETIDSGLTGDGTAFAEYKAGVDAVIERYGSIDEYAGAFGNAQDNWAFALQNQINDYAGCGCLFCRTSVLPDFITADDTVDTQADVTLYSRAEGYESSRYVLYYRKGVCGGMIAAVSPGEDGIFQHSFDEASGTYRIQDGQDDRLMMVYGTDHAPMVSLAGLSDNNCSLPCLSTDSPAWMSDLKTDKKNVLSVECKIALPWHNYADKAASKIARKNDTYHFAVNADDEAVDESILYNLDKFDVVIWIGHGITEGVFGTCLQTGLPAPADAAVASDGEFVDIGGLCCISSQFIYNNFNDGAFAGQIFFIGCCNPNSDFSIPQALIDKGAECVFVFTGTTSTEYDYDMCRTVFTGMSNGLSAQEALERAQKKHGESDPKHYGTSLRIFGNAEVKL